VILTRQVNWNPRNSPYWITRHQRVELAKSFVVLEHATAATRGQAQRRYARNDCPDTSHSGG
jgi:hypothetical protein